MMKKMNNELKRAGFGSSVRTVQSGVTINFFAGLADTAAEIDDNSDTNDALGAEQIKQIFQRSLTMADNIASFDGKYDCNNDFVGSGIDLSKGATLINEQSNTGWIGNKVGDANGNFAKPQVLAVEYLTARRLPSLLLVGWDKDNYPKEFYINIIEDSGVVHTVTQNDAKEELSEEQNEESAYSYKFDFDDKPEFEYDVIKRVELNVTKWSRGRVLPRIRAFVGEMNEGFDNSTLQSIEVLEEKTASIDKLSYDISSNMCKVSFLNRDKKFYQPEYYAMLKANRSVVPYVKLNDGSDTKAMSDSSQQLGKFFSKNWDLDDSSAFMSVTAYDLLYSLQSVVINFGMDESERDEESGLKIGAYRNMTVGQVIDRVFELINKVRRDNGIFEPINHDKIQLDQDKLDMVIPYVLMEEQDAWLCLQEIGTLCGAYVYMDRSGTVVIKSDQTTTQLDSKRRVIKSDGEYNSYKVVETEYIVEDEISIRENGLNEFEYDASLFAVIGKDDDYNTPYEIETLAKGLLEQYKNGVGYVQTEWCGDPALELGSIFLAQSQYEKSPRVYACMRNEITRNDRGFRMKTTGREVLSAKLEDYSDSILISPSNAFSFSIPVLSRTIVNRVVVRYKILTEYDKSENDEPDIITIKREQCKQILDENENPTGRYTVTVKLDKVYDRIEKVITKVKDGEPPKFKEIRTSTANSLNIIIEETGKFKDFNIEIN
jgi:hypothetical protein